MQRRKFLTNASIGCPSDFHRNFSHLDTLRHFESEAVAPYVYTYPLKTAYAPVCGQEDHRKAWNNFSGKANLYVHIPYCQMKCSFCTLFTTTAHDPLEHENYVRAVCKEMTSVARCMGDASKVVLQSIHFGGGTPSVLPPRLIAVLLDHASRTFDVSEVIEVALEGSPATFTPEYVVGLRAGGVTAVSLGVQSFADRDLQPMGRRIDRGRSHTALEAAVAAGFKNVTVDLINGLPGQEFSAFACNLRTAVDLGVKTMQVYPLEVRARTKYGRQGLTNSVGQIFKRQTYARDFLRSNGFHWRALPTFGRDGAHTCDNWQERLEFQGVPTIGVGAGARSLAPDRHFVADDYCNPKVPSSVLRKYYENVAAGRCTALNVVRLTREQQCRRLWLLSLLTSEGVDVMNLKSKFDLHDPWFPEEMGALSVQGYVDAMTPDRVKLNDAGLMASSAIAQLFIEERGSSASRYYSAQRAEKDASA